MHPPGPEGPLAVQQLPPALQQTSPVQPSMLGPQPLASQVMFELQLGPPSVTSRTTVLPGRALIPGRSTSSDAAVGVPPFGSTLVAFLNLVVVGPSVPVYTSPGRTDMTSVPTPQSSCAL